MAVGVTYAIAPHPIASTPFICLVHNRSHVGLWQLAHLLPPWQLHFVIFPRWIGVEVIGVNLAKILRGQSVVRSWWQDITGTDSETPQQPSAVGNWRDILFCSWLGVHVVSRDPVQCVWVWFVVGGQPHAVVWRTSSVILCKCTWVTWSYVGVGKWVCSTNLAHCRQWFNIL